MYPPSTLKRSFIVKVNSFYKETNVSFLSECFILKKGNVTFVSLETLTGLMPVSIPTYPVKLVDLKTVLPFRLKSTFTTSGLSFSVRVQV